MATDLVFPSLKLLAILSGIYFNFSIAFSIFFTVFLLTGAFLLK
jgi:hypothetical protein